MARRAAVQQLQAELNTDEELEEFLDRPGLLVIDIYTEWCGPCLGLVGTLRKIKLDIGGDNLQLAVAKSDTITPFHRFYKKSEPTWLFVTGKRAVNICFGTDAPQVANMVIKELGLLSKSLSQRPNFALDELLPAEHDRLDVKLAEAAAAEAKERHEREKRRIEYLMEVTNSIIENLPDAGVTLFGPHISRDMFKKLNEPAEEMRMVCKDRRMQTLTKEDFETINFACKNPLDPEVIEQLLDKELFSCFWRFGEMNGRKSYEILNAYAHELMKSHMTPDGEVMAPIVSPLKLKVQYEIPEDEECPPEPEEDAPKLPPPPPPPPPQEKRPTVSPTMVRQPTMEEEGHEYALSEEGEEEDMLTVVPETSMLEGAPPNIDFDFDLISSIGSEQGEEEETGDDGPPRKMCKRTVVLPGIWVANNSRTQAALIYVLYRNQTSGFLAPDPVPEPPHIIMAFDTYKKRDLIDFADRRPDEIPLYGFFTSDDVDDAKYIASSSTVYTHKPQNSSDKLVFKVNKRTSHTMLNLASYGPTYVSPNLAIGETDVAKFFPENYVPPEIEKLQFEKEPKIVDVPKDKEKKKMTRMSSKKEVAEKSSELPTESSAPAESGVEGDETAVEALEADSPEAPTEMAGEIPIESEVAPTGEQEAAGEGIPQEPKPVSEEIPNELGPEATQAEHPTESQAEVASEVPPTVDDVAPAEMPTETMVEEPKTEIVADVVPTANEIPAEVPPEVPVEVPVEAPVEVPAEVPAEQPAEQEQSIEATQKEEAA